MTLLKPAVSGLLLVCFAALASHPAEAVLIQYVPVGDAGNAGDTQKMKQDQSSGYGAVPYAYQIGKYDVTNSQYAEFLNAKDSTGVNTLGLYNGTQGTDGNSAGISFNPIGKHGLRLGNLKSSVGRVILITIAFPLVREPGMERHQYVVGNIVKF